MAHAIVVPGQLRACDIQYTAHKRNRRFVGNLATRDFHLCIFYETPNGGAVFATSSIAWAGALAHNHYDNNVSRIMANVLRRFLDATPL